MADLDAAAADFGDRYGLASIEGGRHPGWGTANRIVPLGDAYLELVAVMDPAEAGGSPFGRWVADSEPGHALGWAARTSDLDAVARRLGLPTVAGARERSDGLRLSWRLAGVERAAAEPALPFFIEWGTATRLPGRAAAEHRGGPVRVAGLELLGDQERIDGWLGPHELPLVVAGGGPAIARVVLERASGERFSVAGQ